MTILINAHALKHSFGARPLFEGVSFSVETGDRIGLIGPNGAGKSTLLRIVAGQASPDEGRISVSRGIKIGFLEQVPRFTPGATIFSTAMEGTGKTSEPDWEISSWVGEVLGRLELDGSKGITPDTPVELLSGGWKKRAGLARELVKRPDLLLLDEPTNHLDLDSILWLEEFLASSRFATLTITHDCAFLEAVSTQIFELDRRNPDGLLKVQGSYSTYLETKAANMAIQEVQETRLKNTLKRETEWLRRGAKARTTKQQARIQRAESLGDEVAELSKRNVTRTARLDFQSAEKNPKKLLEAKGISKSYGDKKLFADLDLLLGPGTRIGLLGSNGCGKSTLIRVLLDDEDSDTGTVMRADLFKPIYFEQNRDRLDPEKTVMRTICPTGDHVTYRGGRIHIRSYLDRFLFEAGQMEMRVGKLSGGEQARLLLAELMLQEANVLILDEPTNDLDMATLGVLQDCLEDFDGAIILVSHDRFFLDQVTNKLLSFEGNGKIVPYADLAQWETHFRARKAAEAPQGKGWGAAPAASSGSSSGSGNKKKKLGFKDQRELDQMEGALAAAEKLLADLTEQSGTPEVMKSPAKLREVTEKMTAAQTEIERLYTRWSELEAQG